MVREGAEELSAVGLEEHEKGRVNQSADEDLPALFTDRGAHMTALSADKRVHIMLVGWMLSRGGRTRLVPHG